MQNNLYLYSRFGERVYQSNDQFYMFGSSSKGNSLFIKNLKMLIDLGFSYKKYKDYNINFFLKVKYILLTHEHGDHLNLHTLSTILSMYPHIKIILSPYLHERLLNHEYPGDFDINTLKQYENRFMILSKPTELKIDSETYVKYQPYITQHGNIKNIAIKLTINDNYNILYASDLDTFHPNPITHIDGLPTDTMFDSIFLEANYDETLVNEALQRDPNDFKALGNKRHISEQTTLKYVQRYLKDNGVFIPLHASSTYGTLIQDTD